MSAVREIRDHAKMFGWSCRREAMGDTFVLGGNMVAVDYRKDGTVDRGYRYRFHVATGPKLCEATPIRNKKSTVVSWLVSLGG
jgi:hypothetical protein